MTPAEKCTDQQDGYDGQVRESEMGETVCGFHAYGRIRMFSNTQRSGGMPGSGLARRARRFSSP